MTGVVPGRFAGLYDERTDTVLERLMRLHPKAIDLSLGRVERLLAALGHPELALPRVVHVAGTNGKGSVLAYLSAALTAAGRRVHVYTSPHLVRFAERICLAGPAGPRPIDEPWLVDLLEECERANGAAEITFFEITTAAAFLAFARTPADVVLLETGLGGRLDATNVIPRPAVSVITPISIDHQSYLGESVFEIATEKAGILKAGVPAVIGAQEAPARTAIDEVATRLGVPLIAQGEAWDAYEQHGRLVYQDASGLIDLPRPRLFGYHQIGNAGIAVAAMRTALGDLVGEKHIAAGLENADWPARLERLGQGRLSGHLGPDAEFWLDGGHNEAAAIAIAGAMAELEERVARPLRLVVGMMAGKDVSGFMNAFVGLADRVVAVPIPGHENALAPEAVAAAANACGISATTAPDIATALEVASAGEAEVRILVTGSLYLAGHVLKLHRGYALPPA
jgi:dihydrofolate synthase/folylpolyglutamate synthase